MDDRWSLVLLGRNLTDEKAGQVVNRCLVTTWFTPPRHEPFPFKELTGLGSPASAQRAATRGLFFDFYIISPIGDGNGFQPEEQSLLIGGFQKFLDHAKPPLRYRDR